jgi:hypothetical protein
MAITKSCSTQIAIKFCFLSPKTTLFKIFHETKDVVKHLEYMEERKSLKDHGFLITRLLWHLDTF